MKKLFREIKNKEECLKKMLLKCWIRTDGRRIYGNSNEYFSNFVWNIYNKNNKKLKDDDFYILHKDGDLLNDDISNLEKINIYEHKEEYLNEMQKMCRIRKGRRLIGHGKPPFAQLVWNIYNKHDPIIKGDGYSIHHKNSNKLDDSISNLQKLTKSQHRIEHNIGNKYFVGRKLSEGHKKIISDYNKGKIVSEETKRKLSKPVFANFIRYKSVTIAAESLNISKSTIIRRIKAKKPGYSYINKEEKQ